MVCFFHKWQRVGTSYEQDYDHVWDSQGYVKSTTKVFKCGKCSKVKRQTVDGYEDCPLHIAGQERKLVIRKIKEREKWLLRSEKRLLKLQIGS